MQSGEVLKKAIITGITGQDGYYLAKLLLDKGYLVFGVIRENQTGSIERKRVEDLSSNLKILNVDLLNLGAVEELISSINPDEVYNLAAVSSVSYSIDHPHETMQFNVLANLNLLETIKKFKKPIRFFHAASSEIYGNVDESLLPITEETAFNPQSPYALSKVSAYLTTKSYRELYGLFATNGILFNHESPLRRDNFVFKKIINTAARIYLGEKDLKLALGNVDIWRDWGFAGDYVEGMWLSLQQNKSDDYIFCTGTCTQLKDVVEKVFAMKDLNYKDHLIISETFFRTKDVLKNYGCSNKAKQILGWSSKTDINKLISILLDAEIESIKLKWKK